MTAKWPPFAANQERRCQVPCCRENGKSGAKGADKGVGRVISACMSIVGLLTPSNPANTQTITVEAVWKWHCASAQTVKGVWQANKGPTPIRYFAGCRWPSAKDTALAHAQWNHRTRCNLRCSLWQRCVRFSRFVIGCNNNNLPVRNASCVYSL